MQNDRNPLTSDEMSVLQVLVNCGDAERFPTLADCFSVEVAQPAVASLHRRGFVEIDRVERLPEGQTRDAAVSPLAPTVRSTSNLAVTTLADDEAVTVIAHPASWIESVTPTWFEVSARPEAAEVYYRER